jgi:hypothetical protein
MTIEEFDNRVRHLTDAMGAEMTKLFGNFAKDIDVVLEEAHAANLPLHLVLASIDNAKKRLEAIAK